MSENEENNTSQSPGKDSNSFPPATLEQLESSNREETETCKHVNKINNKTLGKRFKEAICNVSKGDPFLSKMLTLFL